MLDLAIPLSLLGELNVDTIDEFAKLALDAVIERLTDIVFLEIEESPSLKPTYECLANGEKEYLNSRIGKYVRVRLELINLGRCTTPRSKLIESYERHELPEERS